MLIQPVTDRRAWSRDTVDDPRSWYCPIPTPCVEVIDTMLRNWRRQPVTELRLTREQRAACAEPMQPILDRLEAGRGFVIIEPPDRWSAEELTVAYWLVGQMLGEPFAQNVQGTLLYDVRDTGQDVRYGARFSVTNAESSFHTDNSFGDDVLDYVGLLCRRTARSGGLSQLVSAYAAHNELQRRNSEALDVLSRPFHVDRRGGLRPGDAPTARFPVFSRDGSGLTCRYLRYWIEAGHDKAGEPLTPAQRDALDALDAVLNEPELRVEFNLKPGDMFFINNRWLFHNRTAYEDHAEPERKRHYVRLWLKARRASGEMR